MKIVHFSWEFPPTIVGGLGTVAMELSSMQVKMGNEVVVFTLNKDNKLITVDNFKGVEVHRPMISDFTSTFFLFADDELRKWGEGFKFFADVVTYNILSASKLVNLLVRKYGRVFDIIHAHDWLGIMAGISAKKELGIPLIFHVHSTEKGRTMGRGSKIIEEMEYAGGDEADAAEFQTLQGACVGDAVRLTYPNGVQREYTIKGIFRARESHADRTAFVTRGEMASVMGRAVYDDRASQIVVSICNPGTEAHLIDTIESLGFHGVVRSWSEHGEAAGGIVSSFEVVAGLIGGIGLAVAGIVMFIVIYINIIHSRRHIGILRAIGIKRSVIVGSYLTQALFYATTGIVLGGLAFGFGLQTYFLHHPLDLSIGRVSLGLQPATVQNAIIGLVAAAVLAGLVPVLHITRQGIIKAIWGD